MSRNLFQENRSEELNRDIPEVRAGERAFEKNVLLDDCPYPKGNARRTPWMTGWYDGRMRARLGHVFKKHDISWP